MFVSNKAMLSLQDVEEIWNVVLHGLLMDIFFQSSARFQGAHHRDQTLVSFAELWIPKDLDISWLPRDVIAERLAMRTY